MSGAALIWAAKYIFKVKHYFNSLVIQPCCHLYTTADAMQIFGFDEKFKQNLSSFIQKVVFKTNIKYIYILTLMSFLDKLHVKCKSFREIKSDMMKLLIEVLDKHTVHHLFRSSPLKLSTLLR